MKYPKKNNISKVFTDSHIADICAARLKGLTWNKLKKSLNKKHSTDHSTDAHRRAYTAYKDLFEMENKELYVKKLQEISRTKKGSSKNAKDNRHLVEVLNSRVDILEAISEMIKELPKSKRKKVKSIKKRKGLKSMTKELLLSDIHFGKKTKTFNLKVCRARLQDLTSVLIDDIKRDSKNYNVDTLVIALLGDIIESFEMHNLESARGCEFGTAMQMAESINSLFLDVLKPLAELGIPMKCPSVSGNHDRVDLKKTMTDPGLNCLTYTIYKSLELLCAQAGYNHVSFCIPEGPYVTLDIYGTKVLYEHGDASLFKGKNSSRFDNVISKRSVQLGVLIDCVRSGHMHEFAVHGRGRAVQNGSIPGQDSFANVLGYNSEAGQAIISYVETKNRPTSFFKVFLVDLEAIK